MGFPKQSFNINVMYVLSFPFAIKLVFSISSSASLGSSSDVGLSDSRISLTGG